MIGGGEAKSQGKKKERKTNELTKGENEREEVNAVKDKGGQVMSLSEDAQEEEDEAKADRPDPAINDHLRELNFQQGGATKSKQKRPTRNTRRTEVM